MELAVGPEHFFRQFIHGSPKNFSASNQFNLIATYGQLSFAVADTAVDICVPFAEFVEAIASTVTVPDAPGTHSAKPVWFMVAIFEWEVLQVPE